MTDPDDETPAVIEASPSFDTREEQSIRALLRGCAELYLAAGAAVMTAGEPCDSAYLVLEGGLEVMFDRGWGQERVLEEIGPGGMAGDVELLNGDHCIADVRARCDSRLLVLSGDDFERFLQARPDSWDQMSERARSRACRLLVAREITELFGIDNLKFADASNRRRAEQEWLAFEQEILVELEQSADWVTLERGRYLFRQGDPPDGAYVLVSGLLRVSVEDASGKEKTIARIRQGEILGEMSLITDDVRSASISALRDCELFRLPARVFALVTEKYPRSVLNVYRTVTNRFRHSLSGPVYREQTSNIALFAATADFDLAAFSRQLADALSDYDTVGSLDSTVVDQALGRPGISQSQGHEPAKLRLVQWLNAREAHFGHLVYRADPGRSTWNERCLRQADRVVLVADASQEGLSNLDSIRPDGGNAGSGWSLVLVHPPDTSHPVDTSRWLDHCDVDAVFHVREGHRGDLARLARILSGRAVSLVLGGGGARGFAHLGVLRALEELGIPIDMIGGTSIGAPIAGWVAQGRNATECMQAAKRAFRSLIDFTLPTTALLTGKRISRMITEEAADQDIEDFWLPYFCVSTNLTQSRVEVHRRGCAARAVRSSVSIPGVLPPVPERGELLVDGGVLNNLPVDVMRELNPSGIVIAIDVVLPRSFFATEDYGLNVSGWRQLMARLVPGVNGPRTPGLANVIMQSMMVGSSHSRERLLEQDHADFYQNIHVHDVALLQFDSLEKAAAVGYSESIGPLREWAESEPMLSVRGTTGGLPDTNRP